MSTVSTNRLFFGLSGTTTQPLRCRREQLEAPQGTKCTIQIFCLLYFPSFYPALKSAAFDFSMSLGEKRADDDCSFLGGGGSHVQDWVTGLFIYHDCVPLDLFFYQLYTVSTRLFSWDFIHVMSEDPNVFLPLSLLLPICLDSALQN